MAKTLANIRQYDGEDGEVYIAPVGTTAPTDLADPGADYEGTGWLSEEGVSIGREEDRTERRAWQGNAIVKVTKVNTDTVTFQCLEETATVLGLYYAGATFTTATGVTTVTIPTAGQSNERAMLVDKHDPSGNSGAGITKRYVIPVADIGPGAEVGSTQEGTVYEFTATIMGEEFYIITDNPAVDDDES